MTRDIIFSQKIAELDFKYNQKLGTGVCQSMLGAFGDSYRFIGF
jgi:hypothetical protein